MMRLCLIIIISFLLQSCMDAAVTGAQVAYNHDHIKKSFDDQYITTQAYRKLLRDTDRFDNANISVATFNKEVLITGQIPTAEEKEAVTTIVKSIPDIKKVYNLAEIGVPSSAITRVSDSWITAKIKSQLIATNDIEPDKIKVVTENGTVYLMGIVIADQADTAVDIARSTAGVQSVVKILTYLRVSKS